MSDSTLESLFALHCTEKNGQETDNNTSDNNTNIKFYFSPFLVGLKTAITFYAVNHGPVVIYASACKYSERIRQKSTLHTQAFTCKWYV